MQFFTRTGLPKGDLSRVWRAAKRAAPADGEGLTPQQFAAALRVVTYAQVLFVGWLLLSCSLCASCIFCTASHFAVCYCTVAQAHCMCRFD